MLSIYMRSCSAMAIGIGAEGARMMLKWGNRGKLARVAKRAIEWDRILQQIDIAYIDLSRWPKKGQGNDGANVHIDCRRR